MRGRAARELIREVPMARRSKIIAGLKDAVRCARGNLSRGKAYRMRFPVPAKAKRKQGRQVHGGAG